MSNQVAEKIEFLAAVLLVSKDTKRLTDFYRDIVGVPLEDESHGDSAPHYGCSLGDVHFAIHSIEDFPDRKSAPGAVKLAFVTFDIHGLYKSLVERGVTPLYPVKDTGFFMSTAINDPDGNFIEFTQYSAKLFGMIEKRKVGTLDLIQRWKARGTHGKA